MINISFVELTKKFPKDTLWVSSCLEIIGYSAKENLHIVIEDGNCRSKSGDYLVHEYKPKNPEFHKAHWNTEKYPYKYLSDNYAEKVLEERMDFSSLYKENLKQEITESMVLGVIDIVQDTTTDKVEKIQDLIFNALTKDENDLVD
jgi:hypothetical protein